MSEVNEFKIIVNGAMDHIVEVREDVLTRGETGVVESAEYRIYFHSEQQGEVLENCGDAFTKAVEIGLDATTK